MPRSSICQKPQHSAAQSSLYHGAATLHLHHDRSNPSAVVRGVIDRGSRVLHLSCCTLVGKKERGILTFFLYSGLVTPAPSFSLSLSLSTCTSSSLYLSRFSTCLLFLPAFFFSLPTFCLYQFPSLYISLSLSPYLLSLCFLPI